MAKTVARSKSMTLKRSKRSTRYMDDAPLPVSNPQFIGTDAEPRADLQAIEKAPPKRADSGTASASGDEMPRPRTANSAMERSRALHTKGAPIAVQADEQTYEFPTPSPEAVYQSREKLHQDHSTPIGMALGSPSQTRANAWKQSHPAATAAASVEEAPEPDPVPVRRPTTSEGKKKISRWKSIFGIRPADKPPATPAPFYQLQSPAPPMPAMPAPPARTNTQTEDNASLRDNEKSKPSKSEEKKTKGRSRSKSSAAADSRPAALPLDPPKMPKGFPDQGSPKPPPKDHPSPEKKKSRFAKFHDHGKEPRPQLVRAETSPMLNVDIPTIEMERYSVMFGSLLKGDRQSNLLMRRQGAADRLKPLNSDSLKMADKTLAKQDDEEPELPRPRRATSPATPSFQTPTFALSLFPRDSMSDSRAGSPAPGRGPSPQPQNLAAPKPHKLQRSFTAPISPSRRTFDTDGRNVSSSSREADKPVIAKHITAEPEAEVKLRPRKEDLISPAFTTSTRDSEASLESIDSAETAILVNDRWRRPGLNQDVDADAWEMVTVKKPTALQVETQVAQRSVGGSGSGSGSTLSLQSQSPLSSLSGQSFAQAKETVARQNSLLEKQRQQRLERETQSPTTHAQAAATTTTTSSSSSPKRDRKPSYASEHQTGEVRDKDAEMMVQQQQQFRERKQKQKEEQSQSQQQQANLPKRQPTLKERAEEVQAAHRIAIARQVSISRQRAQAEMLRAQKATAASHNANASNGIGSTTISSNQRRTSQSTTDSISISNQSATHSPAGSTSSPASTGTTGAPQTPPSAQGLPSLVIPTEDDKPKLARQESLRRAGRNGTPTTMVVQSPTGERLVERRTLTPVLVDIPNRKSVVGQVVDEGDYLDEPLPMPSKPFALSADQRPSSTVSFSHLCC